MHTHGPDNRGKDSDRQNDTSSIRISTGLYRDLMLCKEAFQAGIRKHGRAVFDRGMQVIETIPEPGDVSTRETSSAMTWAAKELELLSQMFTATSLLTTLLENPNIISNPATRKMGDTPIQYLVTELRELSKSPAASQVGACFARGDGGEMVNASLSKLFLTHGKELSKLVAIPTCS